MEQKLSKIIEESRHIHTQHTYILVIMQLSLHYKFSHFNLITLKVYELHLLIALQYFIFHKTVFTLWDNSLILELELPDDMKTVFNKNEKINLKKISVIHILTLSERVIKNDLIII